MSTQTSIDFQQAKRDHLDAIKSDPPVGRNHPETSHVAAERAKTGAPTQRERVYEFIEGEKGHGATDHEIVAATSISLNAVNPRRGELVRAQVVYDSGRVRRTPQGGQAIVWVAEGC